jgi:hypothetical protein
MLLVTDPTTNRHRRKKCVIVCSRIHPGETPASHCMAGFLNYITSNRPEVVSTNMIVPQEVRDRVQPHPPGGDARLALHGRIPQLHHQQQAGSGNLHF